LLNLPQMSGRLGYQCCFCAAGIESGGFDIGMLLYTTNWDKSESEQHVQQFFCHANCLRTALHPSTPIYVLEELDDSSTQL
jgi:hypothetical protein